MPFFEVSIPARQKGENDLRSTEVAPNWLAALRGCLAGLGEDPATLTNMVCDIQPDGAVHITDAYTNRWFKVRQVAAPAADEETTVRAPTAEHEVRKGEALAEAAAPPPAVDDEQTVPMADVPQHEPLGGSAFESSATVPMARPSPLVASVSTGAMRVMTGSFRVERTDAGFKLTDPSIHAPREQRAIEEVLADIFERTMDLFADLDPDRIVNELLDLALEKVPAEAGTFYVADISSHDLQFAAVRGPKAKQLLASGRRVRMGEGVAGLCAQENAVLVYDQTENSPWVLQEIRELTGYEPRSMLCVPVERYQRTYGALQLINRKGATAFSDADINIVAAIAQQAVELLTQVRT